MAKVRCERVTDGLRASEAVATLRDHSGRRHFIRVERDLLSQENGSAFLPIGIVHVDPRSKMILIELPHEAETGANRLWVTPDQMDEPIEAFASSQLLLSGSFSSTEVAQALGLEMEGRKHAGHFHRIAKSLVKLGYRRITQRIDGAFKKLWVKT